VTNNDEATKIPIGYVNLALTPMRRRKYCGLALGEVVAELSMYFNENALCWNKLVQ